VSDVIAGAGYTIPIESTLNVADGAEAEIVLDQSQPEPAPLLIVVDGSVIGTVGPRHYNDVSFLRDIGIPLSVHIEATEDGIGLDLRMVTEAT
jgi:hypothetical protein